MIDEQGTKLGTAVRERRRIAEELRRSEERYRALVETAFAGISITNSQETLTFANSGLAEILGYKPGELEGTNLADLTSPGEFSRYREFTRRRQEGLRNYYETTLFQKDGAPVQALISASPLTAADASFEGTIAVVIDVTDLRKAEADLELAKAAYTENLEEMVRQRTMELENAQALLVQSEKMAAMGRLAAGVAHEINNPAGVLLLKLKFLHSIAAEEALSERAVSTLQVAIEQTERIHQIVENLLSFSRPAEGLPRSIDVNDTVIAALDLSSRALSSSGIEFRKELAPSLPPVKADPNELEQVLINLINNAVDAMPNGGTLTLTTALRLNGGVEADVQTHGGGQIVIEVADTGSGIPPDYLARIFDPFFTTKRVGEGTGLGLSISYGIVQKLGGAIDVTSARREGTSMLVRIPVSDAVDG